MLRIFPFEGRFFFFLRLHKVCTLSRHFRFLQVRLRVLRSCKLLLSGLSLLGVLCTRRVVFHELVFSVEACQEKKKKKKEENYFDIRALLFQCCKRVPARWENCDAVSTAFPHHHSLQHRYAFLETKCAKWFNLPRLSVSVTFVFGPFRRPSHSPCLST